MTETLLVATAVVILGGAFVAWLIALPDCSRYDLPNYELFRDPATVSPENSEVRRLIDTLQDRLRDTPRHRRMQLLRRLMDDGFTGSPLDAASLGVEIRPAEADGVAAEWVMAPGSAAGRRLLYLHGGGFTVGSARSHRMITAALAKSCGAAVLAIDYGLMPESRRSRSNRDCQAAYQWLLDHGPGGRGPADELFVAGDSAGGNLTLMLLAWARDAGLRPATAAVAFSPNTDASLTNPTVAGNRHSDPMLGPGLAPLIRLSHPVRLLTTAVASQMLPRNPRMSPLFGALHGLPPTLVQASDCELLLGDALRYVNKAVASGSPVQLQVWPGMVHVWQMFQRVLPEARASIDEAARFMLSQVAAVAPQEARHG